MPGLQLTVVVTTYNRAAILARALAALLHQTGDHAYEILVVDDGSTDSTAAMLDDLTARESRLRVVRQANAGRAAARNTGLAHGRGTYLCYVDSDVVVVPDFVSAHLQAHGLARRQRPAREVFVQGLSLDVHRWEAIGTVPLPRFDPSRAFFDTKNVSIRRTVLEEVGGFDRGFVEYGWEDLELGVRLKQRRVGIFRSARAAGYHFHPPFALEDLARLRRLEEERGRMAARFLRLHPTLDVRLMTQATGFHEGLNAMLTWGGWLDEIRLRPIFAWLVQRGWSEVAATWAQLILNQYNLRELRAARRSAD